LSGECIGFYKSKRYKAIIAYDGTDYYGWQEQLDRPTVVGVLQQTFKKVFKRDVKLFAASRTDAGVHAFGQVATFVIDFDIEPEILLKAWNSKLPVAISIRSLSEVLFTFNPHHSIVEKTYQYAIVRERPLPSDARFVWYYPRNFDDKKLQDCLRLFVGEHDFRSFCSSDYTGNTVRRVCSISLEQVETRYCITFKAPGFLRYMIRRIVGASLYVASHRGFSLDNLKKILDARNPEHTLESAPACGLTLVDIAYRN